MHDKELKIPKNHTEILLMLNDWLDEQQEYWAEVAKVTYRLDYCEGAKQALFQVRHFLANKTMQYILSTSGDEPNESN